MRYLTKITCFLMMLVSGTIFADNAQFTIKVLDEAGNAVSDAKVLINVPNMTGWGWEGKGKDYIHSTDNNGICAVQIEYKGYAGFIVSKDSYYKTIGNILLKKSSGLIQGWESLTIEVVLKKIGNMVPMYAKREHGKLPPTGAEYGYDLTKGDWVAPYGKGETADFIFKFEGSRREEPGTTRFPEVYFDYTLTLAFSNPDDGIQSVLAPPPAGGQSIGNVQNNSELRLAHEAPDVGYEKFLKLRTLREKGKSSYDNTRLDQNYYFRVRTKRDDKGNIISALYGKISGNFEFGMGYVDFVYYLNPDPSSRSLEWDGKNNLLNLKKHSINRPPRN